MKKLIVPVAMIIAVFSSSGCSTYRPETHAPRDLATSPIMLGAGPDGFRAGVDVSEPRSIGSNIKAFYLANRTPINIVGIIASGFAGYSVYQNNFVDKGSSPAKVPDEGFVINIGKGSSGNKFYITFKSSDSDAYEYTYTEEPE